MTLIIIPWFFLFVIFVSPMLTSFHQLEFWQVVLPCPGWFVQSRCSAVFQLWLMTLSFITLHKVLKLITNSFHGRNMERRWNEAEVGSKIAPECVSRCQSVWQILNLRDQFWYMNFKTHELFILIFDKYANVQNMNIWMFIWSILMINFSLPEYFKLFLSVLYF